MSTKHEKRKASTEAGSTPKKVKVESVGVHPQRSQRFQKNGTDGVLNGGCFPGVRT